MAQQYDRMAGFYSKSAAIWDESAEWWDKQYRQEPDPEASRFCQETARRSRGWANKYAQKRDRALAEIDTDPPADPTEDYEY